MRVGSHIRTKLQYLLSAIFLITTSQTAVIPPGTNFIMVGDLEDEFASDGEDDGEFIEEVEEDEVEEEDKKVGGKV